MSTKRFILARGLNAGGTVVKRARRLTLKWDGSDGWTFQEDARVRLNWDNVPEGRRVVVYAELEPRRIKK